MPVLSFREARLDDLERILELEAAGFAPGNREAREVYAQRIATFPHGSLMAWVGERAVGCVFAEIWRWEAQPRAARFCLGHDIASSHDPHHGTELYIASMTVDPACRGQGLGQRVFVGSIERLAAAYPQLDSVLLLVNVHWRQARRIYAGDGFAEIARLPDFFTPTPDCCEDGIVMRRALRR